MAHKVGSGSTKNNRDSNSKRLGLKVGNLEQVSAGSILLKQRGFKVKCGLNVGVGKDFTLYSQIKGIVTIKKGLLSVT
jgi:large subunit ribosomal protein L27